MTTGSTYVTNRPTPLPSSLTKPPLSSFSQKTLHVSGSARPGRYYVVVHFYQPNYLAFLGKVVVSGESAASTLLKFHYCPHVSGCRAVGTSQYREGMIDSVYVGRQTSVLVSIVIPEDKDVWIVSDINCDFFWLVNPWFGSLVNPLSPSIKLQFLLLCFHTFLTKVVGRSC